MYCFNVLRSLLFGLLITCARVILAKEQQQTFFSVAFPKVGVSGEYIAFSVTLPPVDGSRAWNSSPWNIVLLTIEDEQTQEVYVNMTINVYETAGSTQRRSHALQFY